MKSNPKAQKNLSLSVDYFADILAVGGASTSGK